MFAKDWRVFGDEWLGLTVGLTRAQPGVVDGFFIHAPLRLLSIKPVADVFIVVTYLLVDFSFLGVPWGTPQSFVTGQRCSRASDFRRGKVFTSKVTVKINGFYDIFMHSSYRRCNSERLVFT